MGLRFAPLLLVALAAVSCTQTKPQPKAEAPEAPGTVELIVYSGNFAMVREVRSIDLKTGRTKIGLPGVSKALDQNSVIYSWPKGSDARVVSSTYDLGMESSAQLLQRFRGQEVAIVYRSESGHPGQKTRGTLEIAEPGNIVVRVGDQYVVNPLATIEAPANVGIVTIPQLSAEVESKTTGNTNLGVSYMTSGLSWKADYTVTLTPDSDLLDLECWASVTNETGTDYQNAKISFVAGSPNVVMNRRSRMKAKEEFADTTLAAPAEMNIAFGQPEAMGELYAYPYKSQATIRQDQMNRVRMLGSEKVKFKRYYTISPPTVDRDFTGYSGNPTQRFQATMGINFANAEASGLGLPLPGGAIRVFEPDGEGSPRYIGAATLGDTPKDAPISLSLTNAFDIYATGREVSSQRIDKRHVRRTIEIKVANEKKKSVEVSLAQDFGSSWKLESETLKSSRLSAYVNEWKLSLPAGGSQTLRFTVVLGS